MIYQCKQITRGVLAAEWYVIVHGLAIEKQYWERYQIMQKKFYQHQDYKKGEMGKYETYKYKHLTILE